MITREQIPQVVGRPVYDAQGRKIGSAKRMYLDDATGEPAWVTVRTGLFSPHETFVPTTAARVVGGHLEVPFAKDTVKGAPQVVLDPAGHLSAQEEERLYGYYGVATASPTGDGPQAARGTRRGDWAEAEMGPGTGTPRKDRDQGGPAGSADDVSRGGGRDGGGEGEGHGDGHGDGHGGEGVGEQTPPGQGQE